MIYPEKNSVGQIQSPTPFEAVAKGGVYTFLGLGTATFFQFISGIVVIRYVSPAEFGFISLALTVVNISVIIALLGFSNGAPRLISKFMAESNPQKAAVASGNCLIISLIVASSLVLVLGLGSSNISLFLNKPVMKETLSYLSSMVIPLTLIGLLSSIFRGYGDAKAKLIFQDLSHNLLRFSLLAGVVIFKGNFTRILLAYSFAAWGAFFIYLFHGHRRLSGRIHYFLSKSMGLSLIKFSLPLLGVSLLANLIVWASTMILGYLGSSQAIAFFSAPLRVANLIPLPLTAMAYLYLPIATKLVVDSSRNKIRELYRSAAKWISLITLPGILYLFIDAGFVINLLFGPEYQPSTIVLRLLIIGYSIHSLLGPNGMTLIALGDTKSVLKGTLLACLALVIVCLFTVPRYGQIGAAAGTLVAEIVGNVYISLKLYVGYKIIPFSYSSLRHFFLMCIAGGLVGLLWSDAGVHSGAHLHFILFFAIFGFGCAAPIVTRALDQNDLDFIGKLEKKLFGRSRVTEQMRKWRLVA
jgi:O-antigen/teichoic acid export membrane protein